MPLQNFRYYLHDSYNSAGVRECIESQGVTLSEEAWKNVDRPFYELALDCTVSDTGEVTILHAN